MDRWVTPPEWVTSPTWLPLLRENRPGLLSTVKAVKPFTIYRLSHLVEYIVFQLAILYHLSLSFATW